MAHDASYSEASNCKKNILLLSAGMCAQTFALKTMVSQQSVFKSLTGMSTVLCLAGRATTFASCIGCICNANACMYIWDHAYECVHYTSCELNLVMHFSHICRCICLCGAFPTHLQLHLPKALRDVGGRHLAGLSLSNTRCLTIRDMRQY